MAGFNLCWNADQGVAEPPRGFVSGEDSVCGPSASSPATTRASRCRKSLAGKGNATGWAAGIPCRQGKRPVGPLRFLAGNGTRQLDRWNFLPASRTRQLDRWNSLPASRTRQLDRWNSLPASRTRQLNRWNSLPARRNPTVGSLEFLAGKETGGRDCRDCLPGSNPRGAAAFDGLCLQGYPESAG